jgi:formate C-acetyltransferase
MNERTVFLKNETISGRNKTARAPMPKIDLSGIDESLPVRKAMALKAVFEKMPIYIGDKELIVGTRTFFNPHRGNEDGHNNFDYTLESFPKFATDEEIKRFGGDYSKANKCHYTPDLGILLSGGIDGIIESARERMRAADIKPWQTDFLRSVIISYEGLSTLISRYSEYARELSEAADSSEERARLQKIATVTENISHSAPRSFYEAVQLFWFGHLGAIIECFKFICYGRLDVLLTPYLGDTPECDALELIECLLLKMYDQADINDLTYLQKHEGQLVITLGGVDGEGENAASAVTMLFLRALEFTMLPEPEVNLRVNSKNPPEMLDLAARLTVRGANFLSYYNDDLFIKSLIGAGIPERDARCYGFDLCQDVTVPGKSTLWCISNITLVRHVLKAINENDHPDFSSLLSAVKASAKGSIKDSIEAFNKAGEHFMLYRDGRYDEYFSLISDERRGGFDGKHPMCPLPYLSALFHGAIENGTDMIFDSFPIKARGAMIGAAVEGVNALAAIKKLVYDDCEYTLSDVREGCKNNFEGLDYEIMRRRLLSAPKWGNDDEYVDGIAKELLEELLREQSSHVTFEGARVLSGIHQPHPVSTGKTIGATPDGRRAGEPIAVTMTPSNGTMRSGATAALKSASIFNPELLQWNYCIMINYYKSVFSGEGGKDKFKSLINTYFARGGMQHQPNVMDKAELEEAQREPEKYKNLIVRLWGVSAHFVDLSREVQDELIARLS